MDYVGTEPAHGWNNECDFLAAQEIVREYAFGADEAANSKLLAGLASRVREIGIHPDLLADWIMEILDPSMFSKGRLIAELIPLYKKAKGAPGRRSKFKSDDEPETDFEPFRSEPMRWDMLKLPDMIDHITKALYDANAPIFRMEDRMVHVFRFEEASDPEENIRRDAGALVVDDVSQFLLLERIIEHARFVRADKKGVLKGYAPPMQISQHVMAAKDRWQLRQLKGIIEAPTLRRDGSVLDRPGYDPISKLMLDTGGVEYPPIKDHPTKEDALKALRVLKEPFGEFPFVVEDNFESPSLSVALSAVLTGLIRRTLESAPIHGFDAPEAGTGKGLACNVVSMIVTGHKTTAINFSKSDEEFKKLLFSALLANDQVIQIDNITRPLEGESLNSALTESSLRDRVLGASKMATVSTNALFTANGNNLKVKGDTHRRIIACRMDAGERPEERKFRVPNLLAMVADRRPEFVAAGLTILRAFEVAGRPGVEQLQPFGSFEEWSARVRGALVWLDEADPCLSRERMREEEPESINLAVLLRAMHDSEIGWFTADAALKKAEASREAEFARDQQGDDFEDDQGPMLHEAMEVAVPNANVRSLGQYLSRNQDRVMDGLRLQSVLDRKRHVRRYRVIEE
jgi:hypothetical protein